MALDSKINHVYGPPIPAAINTQENEYDGFLLKKYRLEGGEYQSTTTGSIFENMISYVPGGLLDSVKVWKSEYLKPVRDIDNKIRSNYRKNSGGHGGYTFHTLSLREIQIFHTCLVSGINNVMKK